MFYEPAPTRGHFTKEKTYSDLASLIAANNFNGVVDAFAERISEWYLEPIRYYQRQMHPLGFPLNIIAKMYKWKNPGHFAFEVMAVDCLIIDAMSQFAFGELASEGNTFIRFITQYLPNFSGPLQVPIEHHSWYRRQGQLRIRYVHLTTVEDVIWNGFRCGILHQAHAPLYCRIDPGGPAVVQETTGRAIYAVAANLPNAAANLPNPANPYPYGGNDCLTVTVNPWLLFDDLETFFSRYVLNLKERQDQQYDQLRIDFKSKFSDSFGLDITPMT